MAEDELSGKVALVTGSSRGIGMVTALKLASLGASVGINYLSRKDAAEEVARRIADQGGQALLLQGDVTQSREVERIVQECVSIWGHIDILVNNAGTTRDVLVLRMSDEEWDSVVNLNLRATFLCSRAVLKHMIRQRWGRIINVSSVVGIAGNPGQANYAAAKAGLHGFTKALAKEMASRNITVNAIAPGFVMTELTESFLGERKKELLARIPLGRYGTAEDMAEMVAFLASERANYITGQIIAIDGGLSIGAIAL